jgi:predicted TIM-barrel fold metal-dependent hydrolase
VLVHCGGRGWAVPGPLEKVAKLIPDLQVIMGHANLQMRFESGAYWEAISIASGCPNMYLDICDWQVLGAIEEHNIAEFWHVLGVMRNSIGAHRIVWGTDMPMAGKGYEATRTWCRMMHDLPEEAAKYGVTFSSDEADFIRYKNAARLIGLPDE